MSFAFLKPVPESRISSSVSGSGSDSDSDSDSDFDINEYYYKLLYQPGPDYDEIIIPLSLYAFNRLSPSDQQDQLEEIRRRHDVYVNVEESDFIELFKKLNFSDQEKLLSKYLQKFKRERLLSSFKQLDPEHQQRLIESLNHLAPKENLRETEADFRLRRFTQLSRDHTRDVLKLTWKSEDEQEEDSSDWKSFFLGFSIIWFQGQLASAQDKLIGQLSKGVGGTVVIEPHLQDETEEDFKLRTFTELCNKIVDFRVQDKFLNNAVLKLELMAYDCFSDRLILEYDRAAELLYDLSTLGFSLLSAKYQRQKIEEMSNLVDGDTVTIIEESSDDDHFRMTRFTELFNQVPVPTRIDLFEELRTILLKEKRYSEAVRFFRGLGSEDQTDMIEKLSDEIMKYHPIAKEFSWEGESEEDFRLRRFKTVCIKHLSTWEYICWSEADRERVRQGTSDIYHESPYAEFLFDASITWFKAVCANYRRNPSSTIHVILFGEVEFRDVIEKLPEESEEDFRLRRFTESFKRLEFTSQERIVGYIQDTLFSDLGYPKPKGGRCGLSKTPEGRGSFDPEWIKMKLPDVQNQGAAATTRGATATTQGVTATTRGGGGGGRGQGTSRSTVR